MDVRQKIMWAILGLSFVVIELGGLMIMSSNHKNIGLAMILFFSIPFLISLFKIDIGGGNKW